MTTPTTGSRGFGDDFSRPAGFWYVHRGTECKRLVERLDKSAGKPVFVHGRRGVGKSSLLYSHLPRFLEEAGDPRRVSVGHLDVGETVEVHLDDGSDFGAALCEQRILCIDNLDSLLGAPRPKQRAFLSRLLESMGRSDCKAQIIFSLDDDDIGELMAMGAQFSNFQPEMFQVRRIDLVSAIRHVVEAVDGSSDWLDDSLLERINNDAVDLLPRQDLAVGPVVAAIAASELLKLHAAKPDGSVTIEDYVEGERLIGLLENHVKSEFDRLDKEGVASTDNLIRVIDEVLSKDSSSGLSDIEPLAARLGMEISECKALIERIVSETGILRPRGPGRYVLDPNQLYTALRALTRRRRNQLARLENEITEYTEAGLSHGTGLPRDVLKQVIVWQHDLRLDQRDTQFVVDWIMRTHSCTIDDAAYWLRRVEDEDLRLDLVSSAAFDQDPDARLKAAELLRRYDVPEATEILFKLALHDADAKVRERAAYFLAQDASPELAERLRDVASDERSSYRTQAVEALRHFTDEQTIELLLDVAGDRNDDETAVAAIQVLADCAEPRAISGITDLGLNEPDAERRKAINLALSEVAEPTHVGRIIDAVASWRMFRSDEADRDDDAPSAARILLRIALAFVAIVLNVALPGTILLMARRFKAGIAFVALSAFNLWLPFLDLAPSVFGYSIIAHLLMLLVSLVWSAAVLLNARDQFEWPPWSIKTIVRTEVFIAIGVLIAGWGVTFMSGGIPIPPPHGFFHLITGRIGRASLIFLLELLSLGLLFVGRYQAQIMYPVSDLWFGVPMADINAMMSELFLYAWYGLFIGTLLWDVLGISIQRIMFPRMINRFHRREALLGTLLSKDAYADYLVGLILADDPKARKRARKLMISHGESLPPELLLRYGSTSNRSLQQVLEKALSRMETSDSITALANQLEVDVGNTQRLATNALTTRPTMQSLQPLKERSGSMTPYQRQRLLRGKLVYQLRRLGSPGGAATIVVVLVLSFVGWVGSETLLDPYHPLKEHVLLKCDPVSWLPGDEVNYYEQAEWARQRAAAAEILAKQIRRVDYGENEHYEETATSLKHVYNFDCERESDDPASRLLIQLSALSGLTHLAKQDPLLYYAEEPAALSGLLTDPLDIVIGGLGSGNVEILERAVQTLKELKGIGSFDEQLAHMQTEELPRLFGAVLLNRELSAESRQIALEQLRTAGGPGSVEALLDYVLNSGSLYRGHDASGQIRPKAGLGLSGRQSVDESLALSAIDAIGAICNELSLPALERIQQEITGNTLKTAAESAANGSCLAIQDDASEGEIRTVRTLFDAKDYELVVAQADRLLAESESLELLALSGRAHFALGQAESNPSRKMEYWRATNRILSKYIGRFEPDAAALDIDVSAVVELARSRLWIGRGHMDLAWSAADGAKAALDQFGKAVEYFESIYKEPATPAEFGDALSRLLSRLASEGRISGSDYEEYKNVVALAMSFRAAAIIDGGAADDESGEEYRVARQLLEDAVAIDNSSWWSRYLMALTYWGTGDYEEALGFSRLALLGDETFGGNESYELPYRLIYQMREQLDDPVGALEELRTDIQALVADETILAESPWPYYYLAMLYQDFVAPEEGVAACEATFEKAYESARTYVELLGNSEDAWPNLLLLEAAVSSGDVDEPASRNAAKIVAKRLNAFGPSESVAMLLLVMADLSSNDVPAGKSVAPSSRSTELLLSNLPQAYDNTVPVDGWTNWSGEGLRTFVAECSSFSPQRATALSGIIGILEGQRSSTSVKELTDFVNALESATASSSPPPITP